MNQSRIGLALLLLGVLMTIALVLSLAPVRNRGTDLSGLWEGTLEFPGFESRMAFRVSMQPGGVLAASLLFPDQGDREIPADTVRLKDRELRIDVGAVGGSFTGSVDPELKSITGRWRQGRWSHNVALKRVTEIRRPPRPQTPQSPFPYEVVEITFRNDAAGASFAGSLTLPPGDGPFPAALLISGGGAQDRDCTFLWHRPFLVVADHLTRHGIAVLRVDDRGVGESTGDRTQATSADFAEDALAAVAYLKPHPKIDAKRIGLIGHSEGGIIASLAAAESPAIAFIVMLASPGLPGREYHHQFEASSGRALGLDEQTIAAKRDLQERIFAALLNESDLAATEAEVRRILRENDPTLPAERLETAVARFCSPWFRFSLAHDPGATIAAVSCPILALFAARDVQVPPSGNAEAMKRTLQGAGHPDFTVAVLPDLNHFFQTCQTGAPVEYGRIEETFAPDALRRMTAWILDHTPDP